MTVDVVTTQGSKKKAGRPEASVQERLAEEMIKQAQEQGLALTGPDGLLKQLTKTVLETALGAEMTEHLGHAKHADQPDREGTNVRNGTRAKTVV
jgi:putative transposase